MSVKPDEHVSEARFALIVAVACLALAACSSDASSVELTSIQPIEADVVRIVLPTTLYNSWLDVRVIAQYGPTGHRIAGEWRASPGTAVPTNR